MCVLGPAGPVSAQSLLPAPGLSQNTSAATGVQTLAVRQAPAQQQTLAASGPPLTGVAFGAGWCANSSALLCCCPCPPHKH